MMIRNLILVVICVFSFSLINAQKIGYINSEEIMATLPEVKKAQTKIDTLRKSLETDVLSKISALQSKYQVLQAKQAKGEISPKKYEEEAAMIQEEGSKLDAERQNADKQLYEQSALLLSPIREKVQMAINEVAKEQGYNMILDTQSGVILYAIDSVDVSSAVKAKLEK